MRSDLVFYASRVLSSCSSLLLRSTPAQRPIAPAAPQSPGQRVNPNRSRVSPASPHATCVLGIRTSPAAPGAATRMTFTRGCPAPGRDTGHCLPGCHLSVSRLGRLGQYSRQWSSNGRRWRDHSCRLGCHGYSWKPWARRFTHSRATPIRWCGRLRAAEASVSAPWPAALKPIPTPSWLAVERPSTWRPSLTIFSRDLYVEHVQMDEPSPC